MLWFGKVQEKTTGKMFYNVVYWKKKEKEAIHIKAPLSWKTILMIL
jgi:hypothetical protein